MMIHVTDSVSKIQSLIREKISTQVSLYAEGVDRFRVFTPFRFSDGDHLAIVLRKQAGGWVYSDEGHTVMHLSYELDEKDLQKGTRQKIIASALSANGIEERDGEFLIEVKQDEFGNALFSFVQGLLKISDVTFLKRERVQAVFLEDFHSLMDSSVPAERRRFDWFDPSWDPDGRYKVDCKVNGMAKPLFVFALPNDTRVRDATITLQQFELHNTPHNAVGIFENQESINRKVLSRFSDVCGRQFSSLRDNRERIQKYLSETLATGS